LLGLMVAGWSVSACRNEHDSGASAEPHQGRWMLLSMTGSIEIENRGRPVLCPEGRLSGRPVPATADGQRSFIMLEQDTFIFSWLFDHQGSLETFTNGSDAEHSFDLHWLGRWGNLHTESSWDRNDETVRGVVALQAQDPDSESLADLELVIDGRVDGPRTMNGTWSYREETLLSDCASRGSGSGTWAAIPEPDPPEPPLTRRR
jgi:hypothetical protein